MAKHPIQFFENAIQVLLARKTWIGYAAQTPHLPPLRPAVLTSDGEPAHGVLKKFEEHHYPIDFLYAKHYEPAQDVKLILKNYRQLGG